VAVATIGATVTTITVVITVAAIITGVALATAIPLLLSRLPVISKTISRFKNKEEKGSGPSFMA
jgi:hypothetical protein